MLAQVVSFALIFFLAWKWCNRRLPEVFGGALVDLAAV